MPDDSAQDTSSDNAIARGMDDSGVLAALEEYSTRLAQGQSPPREDLFKRFPELRESLANCLDGLEAVHQAMPGLRGVANDAMAALSDPFARSQDERSLGDYRILREVGRGGMGVVYEAEQISLKRRVALKVLPFAAVMDGSQLQRFRNEAQAAASLTHPNQKK